MIICAPARYVTGLLRTTDKAQGRVDVDRPMTWDDFEGSLTVLNPDYAKFPGQTIYHKKTYKVSDFKELTIRIVPGDVVILEGETYDGTEVSSTLYGGNTFQISLPVNLQVKGVLEQKDCTLVDDDFEPVTPPGANEVPEHES